jgi:hypothetical protein
MWTFATMTGLSANGTRDKSLKYRGSSGWPRSLVTSLKITISRESWDEMARSVQSYYPTNTRNVV